MRRFCVQIMIGLLLVGSAGAGGFLELAGEIRIPLPDGWELTGADSVYPFQVINELQTAEVLIFRSEVAADDAVNNSTDLREAVDMIVEDIILTLPEGRLLTSNGYQKDNRAWFVLDFSSIDSLAGATVKHRLMAALYRHPDDYQIMFTLWGKSGAGSIGSEEADIKLIQDLFAYNGPSEATVFAPERSRDMRMILLAALVAVMILVIVFFRKGRLSSKPGFSEESHFWRCECGRMNHDNNSTCRRCGRERSGEVPT
jgi:hypothetical protein